MTYRLSSNPSKPKRMGHPKLLENGEKTAKEIYPKFDPRIDGILEWLRRPWTAEDRLVVIKDV